MKLFRHELGNYGFQFGNLLILGFHGFILTCHKRLEIRNGLLEIALRHRGFLAKLETCTKANHVFTVAKGAADVHHALFIRPIESTNSQGVGIAIVTKACGEAPLASGSKSRG